MRSAVRRLGRVLPSAMLGAALALTAVMPTAQAAAADVESAPWAAGDKTYVTDPSTVTTWEQVAKDDTANIGRIWTDKTVSAKDVALPGGINPVIAKGDSDFLVGLSALSSTSNTITSTTSAQPLDIALVLDVSGSMGETITSTTHEPTYSINQNGFKTYYAKLPNGKFKKIDRITKGFYFDHWELDGTPVEPMTSESDTASGHIQFYTVTVSRTTRLEALKSAACGFIDSTAKANVAISNPEKQHRLSIVSFSSDANIEKPLTACTDGTKEGIKRAVRSLRRGGDTYPGKAMEKAEAAFGAAPRADARKVVVFFTDGNPAPSGTNDFNANLANRGVLGSKALKDDGATVYSIGIFEGADPSKEEVTTNNRFNAYMHAMSSNYPEATAWNDLGKRTENSNYYKAATDADELNSIFQEISNEINSSTGSPTETTEGMANKSGYITFTDELGAYMQVDDFKSIILADQVFAQYNKVAEECPDGPVDTYVFEGGIAGNALYPNGELKDIVVKVQRSKDLAKGDVVTVKIPASLIPLRNFKVESNDSVSTMEIAEAYPLRVFYGVSIKPGVRDAVLSGTADDALRTYIKNNSEGGKTSFYSNLFDRKNVADGKLLGNTIASFVPSKANSFYYFTKDTALYTDPGCEHPLRSEPVAGENYYYKRAYYKQSMDGTTATKDWAITQFKGANFDALSTYWGKAPNGTYFIKAGSPRLTRIDALTLGKGENLTGTATEVINPHWDNIDNPHMINVNLGNNGKLTVEMPGALAVTKDARIAPDKNIDPAVLKDKVFEFEISIPSAANKTLKADVKNAQGEVVSKTFDMKFDKDGKRRQGLRDEETLTIYGLDANAEYTVAEKEIPAGFTQTKAMGDKGAISAGAIAHAEFENTYDVAATEPIASDDFVKYRKDFDNWSVADSFDIRLQAVQAGNPMPKGSAYGLGDRGVKIASATEKNPGGSFGEVVFDRPGTFDYTVSEVKPAGDAMVPGVTYSQAVYKVTVVVKDNGDGTLEVESNTMSKVSSDAGGSLADPEEITNKTAVFVNTFSAESTSAAPVAYKRYVNHGGEGTALKSGMFTFKVESKTPGAPLPEGSDPDGNGAFLVKNQGEEIPLARAAFGPEHAGNTYVYDISEVIPVEATAENGFTVNGMTYDPTVYRAKFDVTAGVAGDHAKVKVAISYYKMAGNREMPLPAGQTPEFTNSYDPADVTLPSAPNDAPLRARKTLDGRDAVAGETFEFTLSAANNASVAALERDEIVFEGDNAATELKASVAGLKNGVPADARFGSITFTKPGAYEFKIRESAPEKDGAGMTYDRHVQKVTVVVTDVDGVLKADVTYTGAATDAAAFTNVYASQHDLGTGFELDVTKTLNGRPQAAGEFGFRIEGVDSDTVPADEASRRLDAKDAKFETVAPADSGVPSLMEKKLNRLHFTQGDAGKTFSYVLREDIPAGDKKLGGVTYDQTTYRIDIKAVDNADGTMRTVATVTKNADGPNRETVGTYDSADGRDVAKVGFTNAYAALPVTVDGTKHDLNLYKVLEGREWREGDTFHFVMSSDSNNDPGAERAEVDVTAAPGTKAGVRVPFSFGGYTFTRPGKYHYTITEVEPAEGKLPGITYSKNAADIVVHVTDNLKGQLEAKAEVHNETFTNVYKAELDHNAAGGLIITKTTNGHDMAKGQFVFQVEVLDGAGTTAKETAKRLGIEQGTSGEFGNVAGKDGQTVEMKSSKPLEFTQADVGKSFKFKVSELGADGRPGAGGTKDGYTYSDAVYTIELAIADNFDGTLKLTTSVTDKDNKTTATESSAAKPVPTKIDFVNSYSAAVPQGSSVTTANLFSKVLTGRDWKKDDSFSFTIKPLNGAPAPEHLKATLSGLTTAAGDAVSFDFGTINFTFDHIKDAPVENGVRTKTFEYEVRENVPGDAKIPGVAYDTHVATLAVTLKDNGAGVLSAATVVSNGAQFTNTYTTEPVNPDGGGAMAKGGIQIVKTLTGRPISAGDFEFTMAPADDATKEKFGDAKVIATNAAELGTDKATGNTAVATTPVRTGLKFALADVGKTYTFELSETKGGGAGYVNDTAKRTLKFTTADNGDGTLSVTVTLDGKEAAVWASDAELAPVSVAFANSYSAGSITVGGQGDVALTGTKQLTGRPMTAGEFHFNATNAKDQTKPADVVATGTNDADGTIAFTGIEYTTEKLNNDAAAGLVTVDRAGKDGDIYTYTYNVSEDEGKSGQGVSVIQGTQTITVKVTDNRAGKLSAEVFYPEGGMVFKNAYGAGADGTKVISLNGTKVLNVKSGATVPNIAGKYTFTLAGSEGAPMPTKTMATNDASGNISFGEITYTMENVFGAPAAKSAQPIAASSPRSKTFTYMVTETGSVAGVTNDPVVTKTITVTVTDNGDGTLSVNKQAESAATDFSFTNTYGVRPSESTPTGEGGFTITKTLSGRDLREGEFEFALVSQAEGDQAVLTAKNDASGKVAFPAISFSAPGEYHYTLAEVDGGLGGVTYDTTVYDVTATVVDNGDGTLGVTWSVSKGDRQLEGREIIFANSYRAAGASITFNAAKVLTGRDLKKGEFTFELRDANGKVLQTAENGAPTEGGYAPIDFAPITYDEPGTYDYRIAEVKGNAEGITYDETVFTYHVVVTDDGSGRLKVEWTAGETGAPVFRNAYLKPEDLRPADPAKPADPGSGGSGDKLVQTGDNANVGIFVAACAGILAIGAGLAARRKRQ